jgi:hypothetical protein
VRFFLCVWAFTTAIFFSQVSFAQPEVIETTICAITKNPSYFDGKVVRVKAKLISGFEVYAIEEPQGQCSISLSNSDGGATASVSLGAMTLNINRPEVILKKDSEFKKFQRLQNAEMYPRKQGESCMDCHRYEISAMMTGRIDYAGEGNGFGHMNMFAARLVLASVSDVIGHDISSRHDAKEFSVKKIRFPTGELHGIVLSPEGKAIEGAEVSVHPVSENQTPIDEDTDWTDEKGRFKLSLPPGSYVLGLNLDTPPSPMFPFPATFFPGTTDEKEAQAIQIADRQTTSVRLQLGSRLRPRILPVRVLWTNGSPVEEANVDLKEVNNPTAVVGSSVSHTGKDGTFDLIGFEGIDYVIQADIYVKPTYKESCAENIIVRSRDVVQGRIEMILNKTGEFCKQIELSPEGGPLSTHVKN